MKQMASGAHGPRDGGGPLGVYRQGSVGARMAALRADAAAGVATAAVLIPQGMGYAMLAGLPPIVGLYAGVLPPLAYALLGRSRHVSVGPVALDSLLVAAAVGAVAEAGSANYVAAAVMLCAMVGVLQLVGGLLGAGGLSNMLSRPVLSGFTSAAALVIGGSQLTHLLSVELPRGAHLHDTVAAALSRSDQWHGLTLSLGLGCVLAMMGLKRFAPGMPRALLVLVGGSTLCWGLGLSEQGVRTVGAVPGGLPSLALPELDLGLMGRLWPSALTIAMVAFVETVSIAKTLGRSTGDEVRPGRELVAVGTANLCSSLSGGYSVTASFSRSAVQSQSGARTPLAGGFTALATGLCLALLAPLLRFVPMACLSAIIVTAVLGMFDWTQARRLYGIKRGDFWVLVFTFGMTLLLGIQYGIVAGVVASLGAFLVGTTRPHVALLGRIPGTEAYLNVARHPHVEQTPGVLIVRVDAQFYFGNMGFLRETLRRLEGGMDGPLRAVVLEAGGINQLDSSAADALREIDDGYRERGVQLLMSHVKGPVRDVLHRAGSLQRLSADGRIFLRTHDALRQLQGQLQPRPAPHPNDPRAPADQVGCSIPPHQNGDGPT